MLIFYGSISLTPSNCSIYGITWEQCIETCENSTSLYAAVGYTVGCALCGYGGLQNITYSSTDTGYTIALKSDSTECVATEDLSTSQKIDRLKICNNNYTKLVRENYTLCAQRLEYSEYLNQSTAVEQCTAWGGTIIGLENDEERALFAEVDSAYSNTSSSWIGLIQESSLSIPAVLGNSITFGWTDPWLSGNGSIVWADGHPVSGYDCASLQVGTGLIQSVECSATNCIGEYCPNFILCATLIQ